VDGRNQSYNSGQKNSESFATKDIMRNEKDQTPESIKGAIISEYLPDLTDSGSSEESDDEEDD